MQFYTAYPAIDRLAFQSSQPKLQPAWVLRYWYLAEGLPRKTTRAALYRRWGKRYPRSPESYQKALLQGDGVYWTVDGANVQLRTPRQLAGGPRKPRGYRQPLANLTATTREWHAHLVGLQIERLHRDPEGYTDPISRKELARQVGFHTDTIRRHLRSLSVETRSVWMPVAPYRAGEDPVVRCARLNRADPTGFFQAIRDANYADLAGIPGPSNLSEDPTAPRWICRRLPNRLRLATTTGLVVPDLATPLGNLLREAYVWLDRHAREDLFVPTIRWLDRTARLARNALRKTRAAVQRRRQNYRKAGLFAPRQTPP